MCVLTYNVITGGVVCRWLTWVVFEKLITRIYYCGRNHNYRVHRMYYYMIIHNTIKYNIILYKSICVQAIHYIRVTTPLYGAGTYTAVT